jgi:hypothetical protein
VFGGTRTDGDFCHQRAGHRNFPQKFKSKDTEMTIHWKGLEEHFLMAQLVFPFKHFRGKKKNQFSDFFSKTPQSLKRVKPRNI